MNGNVGASGTFQKRSPPSSALALVCSTGGVLPKNPCRDVAAAADGDHKVGLKVTEDPLCRRLAELVDLRRSESNIIPRMHSEGPSDLTGPPAPGKAYLIVRDEDFLDHDEPRRSIKQNWQVAEVEVGPDCAEGFDRG